MNKKFASIGILAVFIMMLVLVICIIAAHADGPVAIVSSDGHITYVYPGTSNQPSIVVQPSGAYSYVYPMGPSTPPVTLSVPIYTPPPMPIVIAPPTFAPPSFGGY